MTALALALHILGAVVWVGGMFAAYMCLRPAAGPLEPPVRLKLWSAFFQKFLPWVWIAILLLLASGYWMVFMTFGGLRGLGLHINLMQGIGWMMIVLFLWLFHGPWLKLKRAVAPPTGRPPAPTSTASARSSRSTCRSACWSSSSAPADATGARPRTHKSG